jgi:hypothetical protein
MAGKVIGEYTIHTYSTGCTEVPIARHSIARFFAPKPQFPHESLEAGPQRPEAASVRDRKGAEPQLVGGEGGTQRVGYGTPA